MDDDSDRHSLIAPEKAAVVAHDAQLQGEPAPVAILAWQRLTLVLSASDRLKSRQLFLASVNRKQHMPYRSRQTCFKCLCPDISNVDDKSLACSGLMAD
jgi:hypothetical protein